MDFLRTFARSMVNFFMGQFFKPNIQRRGRIARGTIGVVCLAAGIIAVEKFSWRAGFILMAAGLFALFEAARGWCLMRACGLKTKL